VLLAGADSPSTTPLAAAGFGSVALDVDACVACGACAVTCPTDALRLDGAAATLTVTDADCIGCGSCASACPDEAIHVLDVVPTGRSALEPRVLLADEPVSCRRCGDRYAPRRLLEHARSVLEASGLDPAPV
jgi:ferredoxin